MQEDTDVPNRHMTWWRRAWWIQIDIGPSMRSARGRRRVWRADKRAAELARAGDGIGETQHQAEKRPRVRQGEREREKGRPGTEVQEEGPFEFFQEIFDPRRSQLGSTLLLFGLPCEKKPTQGTLVSSRLKSESKNPIGPEVEVQTHCTSSCICLQQLPLHQQQLGDSKEKLVNVRLISKTDSEVNFDAQSLRGSFMRKRRPLQRRSETRHGSALDSRGRNQRPAGRYVRVGIASRWTSAMTCFRAMLTSSSLDSV